MARSKSKAKVICQLNMLFNRYPLTSQSNAVKFLFYIRESNKEKKEKKKKRKAQMREAGVEIQKVKTKKMADSTCKQHIVLDMSYDDMMSNKVSIILYI